MMEQKQVIYPVIMCGGAGTRLWPVSRTALPKQYHALVGAQTMLHDTIARMSQRRGLEVAAPSFVCAQAHEKIIREQCREVGIEPLHVVLEPVGRNTAPVAAIVSQIIHEQDPDGLILLLPADHFIENKDEFWRCVEQGLDCASKGHLVTFGIHPVRAETGYGYIRKKIELAGGVYSVDAFVEKPDQPTAQSYIDSGDYFWNAGIFLFSPAVMLQAFEAHAPDILRACQDVLKHSKEKNGRLYLDKMTFGKCPSQSLDYAILEKAEQVAVVAPVDVGWNDLGSWAAIADLVHAIDGTSSSHNGDIIALDCDSTYLHTDGPLIAGIGLENMIVVATSDAVLVLPKDRAQDVKQIIAALKAQGRDDLL